MAAKSNNTSTKMMTRPDAGFGMAKNTTVVNKSPDTASKSVNGIKLLAATDGGLSVHYKNNPANGLADLFKLQSALGNAGMQPQPQTRMTPNNVYSPGMIAYNAISKPQKQSTVSYGDDMARGIEQRVASRVAQPRPLRGVSTEGRSTPMSGPTAGMVALGKINDGLGKYHNSLENAGMFGGGQMVDLGPNYGKGWLGPQSGPETRPDPASGPPERTALISDDPNSLMSPNTVGRGVGGVLGSMIGGPLGGALGSKLGGFAMDKAGEYGHPLYGLPRSSNPIAAEYDDPSLNVGQGRGGFIDPMTGMPSQGNSAVQTTPQPQNTAFRPKQSAYPDYYSSWANLPKGLFG
jgi:hypothetical protein